MADDARETFLNSKRIENYAVSNQMAEKWVHLQAPKAFQTWFLILINFYIGLAATVFSPLIHLSRSVTIACISKRSVSFSKIITLITFILQFSCIFTMHCPFCIARLNPDSEVKEIMIDPPNIRTNPVKKGASIDKVLFMKPSYNCLGDQYKPPIATLTRKEDRET